MRCMAATRLALPSEYRVVGLSLKKLAPVTPMAEKMRSVPASRGFVGRGLEDIAFYDGQTGVADG
ncbi:hypothetical protein ACQ86N_33805 [Puia sp. P3]|uniref:hypothetical protein n=1 Tax=Puia sp. P3 TaxID=3423952 RepID=UPI003D670F4A